MTSAQNPRLQLNGNNYTMLRIFCIVLLATLVCQLSVVNYAIAQGNYQQQYANAKALFREGKYNLAMESFKPLISYDKNNPFSEYASFYYAVSAYHQGFESVSKDMFNQIRKLYPTWDQIDETSIWLSRIHFNSKEYYQGISLLNGIRNPKLQAEVAELKKSGVSEIDDIELLKRLHSNYPRDPVIGERYATVLSGQVDSKEDREELERLINAFRLKREDLIEETPPTVFKDVYSVSVLFPFQVNTLEPTPARKRNQYILDLYEGMKLAVDTLAKMGTRISLRAYDTDRNIEKTRKILERDELKNTDLIVGPLFEENKVVQEFSRAYKINLFNPVSNNFDLVRDNPYGFLFQPSLETLGEHSARFLDRYATNKKCIVFMGDTRRDSVLMMSFVKEAAATNLDIIQIERFTKESSGRILSILATPTEYDEFKYPKQFTLPKDSLGCIFVTTDEPVIYSKVISSVTTRKDGVVILGSENWLDQTTDFEKLQSLGVVMSASNYVSFRNSWYRAFQSKFVRVHGRIPSSSTYSDYARLGYDFILFVGYALKKYGVYFQDGLNLGKVNGFVTEGYDFRFSRDNRHVPFIKFRDGELVLLGY
jgi:tetratricopeptide (TPR) repeat protein